MLNSVPVVIRPNTINITETGHAEWKAPNNAVAANGASPPEKIDAISCPNAMPE